MEANVFCTTIKNVNYPSKDVIRGVKVGSKVGSSNTHPVDIYGTSGRGHAWFLEILTFNELQNVAWKRGQKKSAFPRCV